MGIGKRREMNASRDKIHFQVRELFLHIKIKNYDPPPKFFSNIYIKRYACTKREIWLLCHFQRNLTLLVDFEMQEHL